MWDFNTQVNNLTTVCPPTTYTVYIKCPAKYDWQLSTLISCCKSSHLHPSGGVGLRV